MASNKNIKKPNKSVKKVTKTPEAIAGSNPILLTVNGTMVPQRPAKVKLISTARANIKQRAVSW